MSRPSRPASFETAVRLTICKTAGSAYVGSSPTSPIKRHPALFAEAAAKSACKVAVSAVSAAYGANASLRGDLARSLDTPAGGRISQSQSSRTGTSPREGPVRARCYVSPDLFPDTGAS
jgi:hypothetical protein